tara:strand:+ start:1184 stop:2377 length:1194 start_codon:yes stop_codon:yes gene_type:complete
MPSTAETAERYHSLANKRITLKCLFPLEQWVPRKIFPNFRFHWNAIWTHRLALEVACQMKENGWYGNYLSELVSYREAYGQLYSTMPLCSNKSISHYVGLCALDSLLNDKSANNLIYLDEVFSRTVKDGAFTEGGHYSKYVTDCFDRAFDLFESAYGKNDNIVIRDTWKHIKYNLAKVKRWQSLISDTDGVMAVVGDGWYEKVEPTKDEGTFYYQDMTIQRGDNWVVVKNHRQNPFSLHQHPHGDEILIAHKNEWLIKGSGMPSYKKVMAKPWKWRSPNNHFFTESIWDWWSVWRQRVSWSRDKSNSRVVDIKGDTLVVYETGKKIVRFPGDRLKLSNGKIIAWRYGKFTFSVEGINIKLLRSTKAYASTTYGNEESIKVIRISGENIITRISVDDL